MVAAPLPQCASDSSNAGQDANEPVAPDSEAEVTTQSLVSSYAKLKITFFPAVFTQDPPTRHIAVKVRDIDRIQGPRYGTVSRLWIYNMTFDRVRVGYQFAIYIDWTGTGKHYRIYIINGRRPILGTREIRFSSRSRWSG